MTKKNVPTYAANGKRLRNHSEAHVLELERRAVVKLSRDHRGRIKCAQFLTAIGANPVRKTAQLGTQYVFLQRVGPETRIWQHKQMVPNQDVEALFGLPVEADEDLDLYLRAIFRAVPLSVMAKARRPAPASPANVVSIDSGKRKPTPKRRIAA